MTAQPELFDWLRTLYPVWERLDEESVHAAALACFQAARPPPTSIMFFRAAMPRSSRSKGRSTAALADWTSFNPFPVISATALARRAMMPSAGTGGVAAVVFQKKLPNADVTRQRRREGQRRPPDGNQRQRRIGADGQQFAVPPLGIVAARGARWSGNRTRRPECRQFRIEDT